MDKQTVVKAGGTFLPLSYFLTIIFVILRVMDKVDWSWWWVFSPLWIPWALVAFVLGCIGLVFIGAFVLDALDKRRRRRKLQSR